MENQTAQDVIYLISCAANEEIPDKTRIAAMDLEAVYAFASHHMIAAAVAFALESAGYQDKQFSQAIAAAQRKAVIFQNILTNIKSRLEAAGIWYMPLKGAVLKELYPKYGMRQFADHDILFDASRAEDVKTIMESLGFKAEHFGSGNHDCYYKKPCLNFEMHRSLFGPSHDEKLYTYYQYVEEKLLGDGCEKHFSSEDFYLYFLAHEYKHYAASGTGLRSLMDTYVYLNAETLDMDYVATEAEKLGIREFEEKNRTLSFHLFGNGELTDSDQRMLDYILSSGTYGTVMHAVSNKLHKNNWTKSRYLLHRFSVPVSRNNKNYDAFAGCYPFFYNHRILLPILPFYRTFRSMKEGRFSGEARAIREAKNEGLPE